MGRRSLLAEESTFNNMKVVLILAIAVLQINSQGAGHGSGSGDSGGSGYSDMGGPGDGGDWMGGSGYGNWTDGSGYGGDWTDGVYGCCLTKKVWGNINPRRDGIYDLDLASTYSTSTYPRRCSPDGRLDVCIYKKRDLTGAEMTYHTVKYCFARSEYGQSMCLREEGEKPTGYGSGYYGEKPTKPTNE